MVVRAQHQVHALPEEQLLKAECAARVQALAVRRDAPVAAADVVGAVEGLVAHGDDPGRALAVGIGLLQQDERRRVLKSIL